MGHEDPIRTIWLLASNPVTNILNSYGLHLPSWVVYVLAIPVAALAYLALLKPLLPALKWIGSAGRRAVRRPSADEAYRRQQRKGFAGYVRSQLDIIASREEWADRRFADLEAEVEVEGRVRLWRRFNHSLTHEVTVRRERSLATALERSSERLIVLEGDPGSGKSVALRHLASKLAAEAAAAEDPGTIPLYINLRSFRPRAHPVTSEQVRQFIYDSLTLANDRDVVNFLEREFKTGLQDGTWLLLLDSFDEIPDVLSATDSAGVVREYAEAIYGFMGTMNNCRCIVASREFRGPTTLRIPRFRVMPMRAIHQRQLVSRYGLPPSEQDTVLTTVLAADSELARLATNPMFLSMLCSYARDAKSLPASSHAVFEAYFSARFGAEKSRIATRFGVTADYVRTVAEQTAFAMADVASLGLESDRERLLDLLAKGSPGGRERAGKVLSALEYVKLARSAESLGGDPTFSFAHRRFQEYFATCYVLKAPTAVTPDAMLFDGQWRETAVTMLQTRSAAELEGLLGTAASWLETVRSTLEAESGTGSFTWPPGVLHVLGILASGIQDVPGETAEATRVAAGEILALASKRGRDHDRKWALEVALAADLSTAESLLQQGFDSQSSVLQEAAFRSAGRLASPPESLLRGIRRALWTMAADGRLYNERAEIRARVQRLRAATSVANALSVTEALPRVVVAIVVCIPAILAMFYPSEWELCAIFVLCSTVLELRNAMIVLHRRLSALPEVVAIGAGGAAKSLYENGFIVATRSGLVGAVAATWVFGEVPAMIPVGLVCAVLLPLLLAMSARHCAEHGCARAPEAFIVGLLLVVRHSFLAITWPAFRAWLVRWYASRPWRDAEVWLLIAAVTVMLLMAGGIVGLMLFLTAKKSAALYFLVGCVILTTLFMQASAIKRRYVGRIRVRNLRVQTRELTADYLITVLSAVASSSEMRGVMRAIRQGFPPLSAEALQLLADLSLMREASGDYDDLVLQASTAAWLSIDKDAVERALRFFTYEDADDVARIADKMFRDVAVRPLNQQVSQSSS
jgi:NACHT domain